MFYLKSKYWKIRERLFGILECYKNGSLTIRFVNRLISPVLRKLIFIRFLRMPCRCPISNKKVLVVGIYLANKKNTVKQLVDIFSNSENYDVTQYWVALNGVHLSSAVKDVTQRSLSGFIPKFVLLNQVLEDLNWQQYDYLVFCDDDIVMAPNFLDTYLCIQTKLDLALAQPARTSNSYTDHTFVLQNKSGIARLTRFVEIGPLFSISKELGPLILPFDESSPMGWGYDSVWPVIVESAGLKMGIIDGAPVDHSIRPQGVAYSRGKSYKDMEAYLKSNIHLSKDDLHRTIRIITSDSLEGG